MDVPSTKARIFEAAITLFSTEGYANVSVRQIAQAVGIQASSIYNHYPSKEDILMDVFDWYEGNLHHYEPDINDLLALVGHEHPREILKKTIIVYPEDILPHMSKAMLIANTLGPSTPRAETIMRNMINLTVVYDRPLLEKMLALDVIEPIDIDSFISLHSNYSYAAAMRFYRNNKIDTPDFLRSLELLFTLVVPKGGGLEATGNPTET